MIKTVVLLVACLGFVGLGVSSVHAQAKVINGGCGLLSVGSDGKLVWPAIFVEGRAVQAANPGANSVVICRGQLPYSPSKQVTLDYASVEAQIGQGLYCGTPSGPTNNWQQVVTPSGQATLTCHLNPSSNR